jgi:hypothetical protein
MTDFGLSKGSLKPPGPDMGLSSFIRATSASGEEETLTGLTGYQKLYTSSIYKLLKHSAKQRIKNLDFKSWGRLQENWDSFSTVIQLCFVQHYAWDVSSADCINRWRVWFITIGSLKGPSPCHLLEKQLKELATWARLKSCYDSGIIPEAKALKGLAAMTPGHKVDPVDWDLKSAFYGKRFEFENTEDERRSIFFQLSLLSRALPLATDYHRKVERDDNRETLLSNPIIGEEALKHLEYLSFRIGFRLKAKGIKIPADSHLSVSTSAEFSNPVGSGGKVEAIKKLLNNFGRRTSVEDVLLEFPENEDIYSVYGKIIFYGNVLEYFRDHNDSTSLTCPFEKEVPYDPLPEGTKYIRYKSCALCEQLFYKQTRVGIKSLLSGLITLPANLICCRPLSSVLESNLKDILNISYEAEEVHIKKAINSFFLDMTLGDLITVLCLSSFKSYGDWLPLNEEGVAFSPKNLRFWTHSVGSLPISEELFFPYFIPDGSTVDDDLLHLCKPSLNEGSKFRLRFYSIAERGVKVRGITVPQGTFSVPMMLASRMLEVLLENDPRARVSFRSANKLWDFLKVLRQKKCTPKGLLSADLTRSTDFFPFPVIMAMWSGFFTGLGVLRAHPCRSLELLWSSGREVTWDTWKGDPLSKRVNPFEVTTRGSLMAEPQSHCTLNLASLCFCELLEQLAENSLGELFNPHLIRIPSAVTGDDVIAAPLKHKHAKQYLKFVKDIGLKTSIKHVYARTHLNENSKIKSCYGGVFCEDYILVNPSLTWAGPLEPVRCMDIIKPRLLLFKGRTASNADRRLPWLGQTSQLSVQIQYSQGAHCTRPSLGIVAKQLWDLRSIEFLKPFRNLPIWLPTSLGGLNAPLLSEPRDYHRYWLFLEVEFKNPQEFLRKRYSIEKTRSSHGTKIPLVPIFERLKAVLKWDPQLIDSIETIEPMRIISYDEVFRFLKSNKELFPTVDMDSFKSMIQTTRRGLNLIEIDTLMDKIVRAEAFKKLFSSIFVPSSLNEGEEALRERARLERNLYDSIKSLKEIRKLSTPYIGKSSVKPFTSDSIRQMQILLKRNNPLVLLDDTWDAVLLENSPLLEFSSSYKV